MDAVPSIRSGLSFRLAGEGDALGVARLRTAAADRLTAAYGRGHWSGIATERGVLRSIREARVLLALGDDALLGTLTLATRKPWAIDRACFTPARRPLYLVSMAVAPDWQRRGVGRALLERAAEIAREHPTDAIWLDAYDSPAGAGAFYARCGYREVGRRAYRGVPLIYFELRLSP